MFFFYHFTKTDSISSLNRISFFLTHGVIVTIITITVVIVGIIIIIIIINHRILPLTYSQFFRFIHQHPSFATSLFFLPIHSSPSFISSPHISSSTLPPHHRHLPPQSTCEEIIWQNVAEDPPPRCPPSASLPLSTPFSPPPLPFTAPSSPLIPSIPCPASPSLHSPFPSPPYSSFPSSLSSLFFFL